MHLRSTSFYRTITGETSLITAAMLVLYRVSVSVSRFWGGGFLEVFALLGKVTEEVGFLKVFGDG